MSTRLLESRDTLPAKALWKEAFGDSDAFINWYFANKILPHQSLGMFDGGDLISVLHMIPFTIMVQGRPIKSAYIAGAATANKSRGQGYMKKLLLEALKLMKQRGILMTHLYPFKHSFYEPFGWAIYSYVNKASVTQLNAQPDAQVIETLDDQMLAPIYQKMMSGFDGYVVRDERTWRWRMQELASDGGKAVVLMKNDAPSAYMLYYGTKDKADIIETVFTDQADLPPLLKHILDMGYSKAEYFVPAENNTHASPHAMARVVDARALLDAFGAVDVLNHIAIKDDFALWNNTPNRQDKEVNVSQLAQIIHQGGCVHAYNDFRGNTNNNYFKKIFMRQNTCIFETY